MEIKLKAVKYHEDGSKNYTISIIWSYEEDSAYILLKINNEQYLLSKDELKRMFFALL